jgi:type IV secretory pathway protease TraF
LKRAATVTKSTPSVVARSLLVSSLEQPSKEDLTDELARASAEISSVSLEVSLLRQELTELRASLAASVELLLVYFGGISEEDAIKTIDPLFYSEPEGEEE